MSTVPDPFFKSLNNLPTVLRDRIWADFFRLTAEEHADRFLGVHDEMTDYKITVKIGDKMVLKLCRANLYYDIVDLDDLWLNPYIYKHALESQIKMDCLKMLDEFKNVVVKQPVLRCGNVIVKLCDGFYEGVAAPVKTLEYYLSKIPNYKDYAEDMRLYDRRYHIDWLNYVDLLFPYGSQNNGISSVGRGVSGRGLGAVGLDSGTNRGSSDEEDWWSDEESE